MRPRWFNDDVLQRAADQGIVAFQQTGHEACGIDNGVIGTHSSIYKTTGHNGYLADLGIASNEIQSPNWYQLQGWWDAPESYIIGIEATANAEKTSSDLKAKISVKKDPE